MIFGGKRIPKDSPIIEAYGTIDELNSVIGICRSFNASKKADHILEEIQKDLFKLGAGLAGRPVNDTEASENITRADIIRLERYISNFNSSLVPLRSFILPYGSRITSLLHFARTVCRRTERAVIRLRNEKGAAGLPAIYLNRLSDLLFVLARWIGSVNKSSEIKWGGKKRGGG